MNNLLIFSPSSELEKEFIQTLHEDLSLSKINLFFITTNRYKQKQKTFDFGFKFQIRLNYDLYFTKYSFDSGSDPVEVSDEELNYIKNSWDSSLVTVSQDDVEAFKFTIQSIIVRLKPKLAVIWGDHRPFSIACLDVVKLCKVPHLRMDRSFIPNSYRLFDSAFSESVPVSLTQPDEQHLNEAYDALSKFVNSMTFTYSSTTEKTSLEKPYVLFLAGNDIDVGLFPKSRYLNQFNSAFASSNDAYNYISSFLKEKYNIKCYYRVHPYSPFYSLTNAKGDIQTLINEAQFIIATPTGPLFHSALMNKKVLCIGDYSNVEQMPFIQVHTIDALHQSIAKMMTEDSFGLVDFNHMVDYCAKYLVVFSSDKNNYVSFNWKCLIEKIRSYDFESKPILIIEYYWSKILFNVLKFRFSKNK